MQRCKLEFESNFHVIAGNARSQSAVMVLPKGETTGGPENRHADSDQWLYVASGRGEAIIEGQSHALSPGVLLLIVDHLTARLHHRVAVLLGGAVRRLAAAAMLIAGSA